MTKNQLTPEIRDTHIKCSRCGAEKDISNFYKHSGCEFGVSKVCKQCIKEKELSPEQKQRIKEYNKLRNKSPERKEMRKKQCVSYRINNKEKYKAHYTIYNFLNHNPEYRPIKSTISGEEGKLCLHHIDYTRPNVVVPCTPQEHSDIHRGLINIKEEHLIFLPFN